MGLFNKKPTTQTTADWAQELMPNQGDTFARGVSYEQRNITALGKGQHKFALVGDPANRTDKLAVKICAITPKGLCTVGYLERGEFKTEHFQTLALRLEQQRILLVADGRIEPYDGGLGVRIYVPRWQWLKARLAS